jgi:arginine decarboxylase
MTDCLSPAATVPLQDLDQRPDIRAVLTDLTCDSLGVMQNFQALGSSKADSKSAGFLPLHSRPQSPTHPYRVAVCFTGAYNALLNGRHNLFGETDSAGVRVGDNGYTIEWTRSGSSVGDMLRGIGYDTADLEGNVSRLSKAGGIVDKQDWYHKALQEATYPS